MLSVVRMGVIAFFELEPDHQYAIHFEKRKEGRKGKSEFGLTSLLESSSNEKERDFRLTFPIAPAPVGTCPCWLGLVGIGVNPKKVFVIVVGNSCE
jgi:hypothetical protein